MIALSNQLSGKPGWDLIQSRVSKAKEQAGQQGSRDTAVWTGRFFLDDLHCPAAPEYSLREVTDGDNYRKIRDTAKSALRFGATMRPSVLIGGLVWTLKLEPQENGELVTWWVCR